MALQSCYECNKEISTRAIICPQCGAPQNPASGSIDKFFEWLMSYFSDIPERIVKIPAISPNFRKPLKNHYRLLMELMQEQNYGTTMPMRRLPKETI